MMQDSIETLVCFLELLEIQPPILQDQDKSSLTGLLEQLEKLNLDQIQQAANSIEKWCGDHEEQLKLYDQAKKENLEKTLMKLVIVILITVAGLFLIFNSKPQNILNQKIPILKSAL